MKKLLSLMSALSVTAITTSNVLACSNSKDAPINVLPEHEIIDLSKIKGLEIEINTEKNEAEIFNIILANSQFKAIGLQDVKFKDGSFIKPIMEGNKPKNGQVIIESNKTNEKVIKETGVVILKALPPLVTINDLKGLDLDLKDTKGSTANAVIAKFIEQNNKLLYTNVSTKDFTIFKGELNTDKENEVGKTGYGTATIRASGSSKLYKGYVKLKFTIIAKKDLGKMGLNPVLGDVEDNSFYEVNHKFLLINGIPKGPLENNVGFSYKKDESNNDMFWDDGAIIIGGKSELYGGEIEVSFAQR